MGQLTLRNDTCNKRLLVSRACCSVVQCVASVFQYVAVWRNVMQCGAVWCSCVASNKTLSNQSIQTHTCRQPTYTQTDRDRDRYRDTVTQTHKHRHRDTHTQTQAHAHKHTHAYKHTHTTYADTHINTLTKIQPQTHAHTHLPGIICKGIPPP